MTTESPATDATTAEATPATASAEADAAETKTDLSAAIYSPDDIEEILVYAMPGSQFTAKVLAAFDACKIPHTCFFVSPQKAKRAKEIPSGGTLVPEIKITLKTTDEAKDKAKDEAKDEDSTILLKDSEHILEWFNEHYKMADADTLGFFPTPEASVASIRASNGLLAGSVYFYNWVYNDGYERSMKVSVRRFLSIPEWIPAFVTSAPLDMLVAGERRKFAMAAARCTKLTQGGKPLTHADDDKVRKALVEELTHFQTLLSDVSPYMMGQTKPTAADFSVYVQLERLVGDTGDVNIGAAIPELKEATKDSLALLWKWHDAMRKDHPIQFKGKRGVEGKL